MVLHFSVNVLIFLHRLSEILRAFFFPLDGWELKGTAGLQLFEALSSTTIKILHLFLFIALSDWDKIPAFICTCNFDKKGKFKRQVKEFSEGRRLVRCSQRLRVSSCIPPSIKLQSHIGEGNLSLWAEMQKCVWMGGWIVLWSEYYSESSWWSIWHWNGEDFESKRPL